MESYSQNLEDVILDRCFSKQETGFYIDVGAGPADGFSVTKNLYLKGWAGILIEPIKEYAQGLREARPLDKVYNVVAGQSEEDVDFVYFFDTGLSTKRIYTTKSIETKYASELRVLPQLSLNTILKKESIKHVDVLKIDVEGSELEVLKGLNFSTYKPRLIIVEATIPMTDERTNNDIYSLLIYNGYERTLFDGLNEIYVLGTENELKKFASTPVNIFDGQHFKYASQQSDSEKYTDQVIKNSILQEQNFELYRKIEEWKLKSSLQQNAINLLEVQIDNIYNSVRMKIGTFLVKFFWPIKPIKTKCISIFQIFKKNIIKFRSKYFYPIIRQLLKFKVIRVITVMLRLNKFRLTGFWGWNTLSVRLKKLRIICLYSRGKIRLPFDSNAIQSRQGLFSIESSALETLIPDLNSESIHPFSSKNQISKVIVDIRCIQESSLAARGVGKHASFIIEKILNWTQEISLDTYFLISPEIDPPKLNNIESFIYVIPENSNGILYFQLSSMTENPFTCLPILLNENSYKIAIFYDFIPNHNLGYYLGDRYTYNYYNSNLSSLKFYDEFWAISNTVSDELGKFLRANRISSPKILSTGVSAKMPQQLISRNTLNRSDIIIPTGGDARKDPLTALASIIVLQENTDIGKIVFIGHLPQKGKEELLALARGTWTTKHIEFLAPTSFDDIALAYSKASVTLVSSLDEGYSLPVVESIGMNVPIIASKISAHMELLQTRFLFKPKSFIRASSKLAKLLKERKPFISAEFLNPNAQLIPEYIIPNRLKELKNELIFAQSTFDNSEKDGEGMFSLISPWPPVNSGIADYSKSTLSNSNFSIFCSEAVGSNDNSVKKWNWCEIAKTNRVFVLGNNHRFHTSAVYALRKMGGNVLLHDTRMLDFWANHDGNYLHQYLSKFTKISPTEINASFDNLDEAETLGFEPFIPCVYRFLTHSTELSNHLRSLGAEKVTVIPFASRYSEFLLDKNDFEELKEIKIGVFGRVDLKTKHFDLIFHACDGLIKEFPNLRLIHVGEVLPDAEEFLKQEKRRESTWLHAYGPVNETTYWNALSNCNLTIHIRTIKTLSLSGAVMDSLSAGVPILCSESILQEMQIPEVLPFSVSVRNNVSIDEIQDGIRKILAADLGKSSEALKRFAESRNSKSYLVHLTNALVN